MNISEYIKSPQRINELKFQYLILGHNQYLKSDAEIKKEIENALFYLNNISNSDCEIPLAECFVNDISEYAGLNFHKTNILNK